MDVYVDGRRVPLDPTTLVGKGGEAEIFLFGPDQVIKVFKTPDHPDLHGLQAEQEAARDRLEEQQRKLPAFPTGLPSAVVCPSRLATDKRGRRVLGYTMQRIDQAEPLLRLSDPVFRRAFPSGSVLEVFRRLHQTVEALHQRGVVIGDFNDLNVLIQVDQLVDQHRVPTQHQGSAVHLIDADSFQFGPFLSRVFTDRFLDPLLMDGKQPVLHLPYQPTADWFAFGALLMQSLLLVGPWGGIHRPPGGAPRIPPGQRALRRLSVFSSQIQYPRPARPINSLPDDLLAVLQGIFERDQRAPFPRALLDSLTFHRCRSCGLEHARASCPCCQPHAQVHSRPAITVRGNVVARTVFSTEGVILYAAVRAGRLCCVSHQGSGYLDQDGTTLQPGPIAPGLRFIRAPRQWWVVERASAREVRPHPGPSQMPQAATAQAANAGSGPSGSGRGQHYYDHNNVRPPSDAGPALSVEQLAANDRHLYWLAAGGLYRDGTLGPERVGAVLEGQTRFAVGDRFGVGFYRAGNFSTLFTFDVQRVGLREDPSAIQLTGTLLGARFALSDTHAWIFTTVRDRAQVRHSLLVVDAAGKVLGRLEDSALLPVRGAGAGAVPGDGPTAASGPSEWLTSLQADPVAVGPLLFVPTDRGVVRVELVGGVPTVTREFPDTEPFVDSATPLLFDGRGLIAVQTQQVLQLQMS